LADFAYEIDRPGGDDEALRRGDDAGPGEGGGGMRCGVRWDVERVGRGEELFEPGGARIVDGGEEDVVFATFGVSGARVEEREENLRHLFEVLVAKTAEDQGAGLGLRKLSDRGAECPGAGWVVGYVEEQAGAFGEG